MSDDDALTSEPGLDDENSNAPANLPANGAADLDDHSPLIAALLRERDGYVARGRGDRVDQVEAELERLGFERVERATTRQPVTRRPRD